MEKVMVVRREHLFGSDGERNFSGFKSVKEFNPLNIIKTSYLFLPRDDAEHNSAYKQIIPYAVFLTNEGKIFLYRRLKNSGEERLHEKYSIGIGGHINPVDKVGDILIAGMQRELKEEVFCNVREQKLCGFINLEQTSVDSVHFGAVFLVKGNSIEVREREKIEGRLVDIEEAGKYYDKMEDWSKVVYDAIVRGDMSA